MPLPKRREPSVFGRLNSKDGGLPVPPQASGRAPTSAEQQRRYRAGHRAPQTGYPGLVWEEPRNGMPPLVPYTHTPADPADTEAARQAWQRVAEVQARLWGEPPPAPAGEPWNLPPCPGCGHRMRCACPPKDGA